MDEVFLIGNDASPSTKGKDPAEVFAKAVNDMYAHVVKKRGLADDHVGRPAHRRRALRLRRVGGVEEQHLAGDLHDPEGHRHRRLALRDTGLLPVAVALFLDKGFRVLPTSWKDVGPSRRLIEYGQGSESTRASSATSSRAGRSPRSWPTGRRSRRTPGLVRSARGSRAPATPVGRRRRVAVCSPRSAGRPRVPNVDPDENGCGSASALVLGAPRHG